MAVYAIYHYDLRQTQESALIFENSEETTLDRAQEVFEGLLQGKKPFYIPRPKRDGTNAVLDNEVLAKNDRTTLMLICNEKSKNYMEKKDALPVHAAEPAEASVPDGGASGAPRLSSKELRQLRAAERAKAAPRVKELKRRVAVAEKKLEELQAALEKASEELFNPKPTTNFAELNREVQIIQCEIDRYTKEWEDAAMELEGQ